MELLELLIVLLLAGFGWWWLSVRPSAPGERQNCPGSQDFPREKHRGTDMANSLTRGVVAAAASELISSELLRSSKGVWTEEELESRKTAIKQTFKVRAGCS
jgi:NhaP-type Na+/H+ or K+/H+ antiporter